MLHSFIGLMNHVERAWSSALTDQVREWRWALLAYVIVTGSWFAFVRRTQPFSCRGLLKYIFPRELYVDRTARISHFHYVLLVFFWNPVLAAATVFIQGHLSTDIRNHLIGAFGARPTLIHAVWAVVAVQAIVIDCVSGLSSWLVHYSFHRVPFLWSFHRAHHSVESLTLPAVVRQHPVEILIVALWMSLCGGLGGGVLLYLTGTEMSKVTLTLLGSVYFWKHFVAQFNHAHIPISFGWFNRVFEAPVLHQIHHSAEVRHRDKNIGSFGLIAIWDWIFGTLYLPEKDMKYRWGLNDCEYGANNPHLTIRDFYLEPFRYAWGVLRNPGRDDTPSNV